MMALTRAPSALQPADVARSLSPHLFSEKIYTIECSHPPRSLISQYSATSEPHTISILKTLTHKLKNSAVRTMVCETQYFPHDQFLIRITGTKIRSTSCQAAAHPRLVP